MTPSATIIGPDFPLVTDQPRARRPERVGVRRIRAAYDSAQTTSENIRHWLYADALDANSANSPAVRRTLRIRARHEVANNTYARGIVDTLADHLIGTGPRPQVLDGSPEERKFVQEQFMRWAREIGLAAKLRTMRKARVHDGEAFALLRTNPRLRHRVKLDLKLIEADQVATPELDPSARSNAVDGVVFDEFGNPRVYHVLRRHPGDVLSPGDMRYDPVPAEAVIHWFRADRPGQARGIPEITPALPLFAMLRRYTLAVIAAAETAADFAAVIYSDAAAPDDEEGDDPVPMDLFELERRMATVLPAGWKLGQIDSQQPATTYAEFKREVLNEMARCLGMPYNIAAADSSEYNYASGRLDHQSYFKTLMIDRRGCECEVLHQLFRKWLMDASLISGYLPQVYRTLEPPAHMWYWDGFEHVDPAKEALGQKQRLENNTTTLAHECARQGLDWRDVVEQRGEELRLMREHGLGPAPQNTEERDEQDQDEAAPARPRSRR